MIRQLLRASTVLALSMAAPFGAQAADSNMSETSEVQFSSTDAVDLSNKADELSSPVSIFEYVRNNYDYSLYHGARSGSVNTYLGGRGNDVDLAATLIAMLRSQGIPARYAVGTVRIPATQVANWLQVQDTTLAKSLLIDQGIQKVASSTSGSTATIDFEHVWVEALMPYDQYRGAGTQSLSCVGTTPSANCHWVPLDPSFKQYKQAASGLDPYASISFDYTAFYNAIKNNDSARRDKNPLEVYQEQVLAWLGTNAPGKTLRDISDFGDIVAEAPGLLPASLPFTVIGTPRRYNSVADHDAAAASIEAKDWSKTADVSMRVVSPDGGVTLYGGGEVSLTDIVTKRLTITTEVIDNVSTVIMRLGGTRSGGVISIGAPINGWMPSKGDPLTITVTMDGSPGADSTQTDQVIQATYSGMVGGYYLIATGGETSNWSQVHRAAEVLLAANQQYPIVFASSEAGCVPSSGLNCTPYIDGNGNGWDASDVKLENNSDAMDAMTGGLLYVAATQYYAKLKANLAAIDQINKVKTPISGFLGVVSSTYEPEYINGTAFSILPSGLLIDMKGITIAGSWRVNAPATASNSQFNLAGHITSSLEHETWQELTGYDAISTVRGIQMALADGATLLDLKKNSSTDTMASGYTAFGFATGAAPAGFTFAPFSLFGTQPATWTNTVNGKVFDLMLTQLTTSTPAAQQLWYDYQYSTSGGLYGWVSCVNADLADLNSYIAQGYGNSQASMSFCDGSAHSGTINNLVSQLQTFYTGTVIPNKIGQSYFNYFDRAKSFAVANNVYRISPAASPAQFTQMVAKIRNNLYLQDLTKNWVQYIIPSKQSVGTNFKFAVNIRNAFDAPTGDQISAGFEILNQTGIAAGGGFVNMPSANSKPNDSAAAQQ